MTRSLLLLAVAALAACGVTLPLVPDAGTDAAPPPPPSVPPRVLAFDPPEVAAEPSERVPITITLRTRDGAPVAFEEVRLALRDASRDASLSETRVVTDASGRARFDVIASSVATTFRVRAIAAPMYEFNLTVSVSDRGFGRLTVTSRYAGVRGPDRLVVALFHARDCAALADDAIEPVHSVTLGPAGGRLTFNNLGAGQSFAVQGSALGAAGVPLARGCVDGLVPTRDGEVAAALPLDDLPLGASGGYRLALALDLGALPRELAAEWVRAVNARAPMGDVAFVFDAISEAVHARSGAAGQAEFDSARDRLTTELRADYARRAASPLAALARLATDTAASVQGVDAVATVRVTSTAMNPARAAVDDVRYAVDPLTPDVTGDDLSLAGDVGGEGTITALSGDRASVTLQNVSLPLGAVSRRAADALLARLGVASAAEWSQVTLRCRELVAVVGAAAAAEGCDSACVVSACEGAAAQLGVAFDTALVTTGAPYVAVAFSFAGAARGVPGSLRIDSIEPSSLTGNWLMIPGSTVPLVGVARMNAL